MAVKIRLQRRGRKKMAMYDIVIATSTAPRDGRFIEKIGTYNPNNDPASIVLKADRAVYWLMVGAQPTDTTRSILSHQGVMLKKHLQVGVVKGAITQEQADERFLTWTDEKANRVGNVADNKQQSSDKARADKLEAERKVAEARAEAIAKKNIVPEPEPEAPAAVVEPEAEAVAESAVVEAAAAEETPAAE